jgi:hypothetical protein
MSGNVERVLAQIGQSVRPMDEAPKDGHAILGRSATGFIACHWDDTPLKLAGPAWVESHGADRGYLDQYFLGWLDPARLKLWDYATLADLLIAFVDDAHAFGDETTLAVLERRARPHVKPDAEAE